MSYYNPIVRTFGIVRSAFVEVLGLSRTAIRPDTPLQALIPAWANCVPLGLTTVGELTLFLTSFPDHRDSGYRWTRNEISFKVRQIVAGFIGLHLDEVSEQKIFD